MFRENDHDQIELYLLDRLPSASPTLVAIEDHLLWCEPCIAFAEQEQEQITLLLQGSEASAVRLTKRIGTVRCRAAGSPR